MHINYLTENNYFIVASILISIILLIVIVGFIKESRRKSLLFRYFDGRVANPIMKKIIDTSSDLGLNGDERIITVLFNDIRSFSELSERLSKKKILKFVNTYYHCISDILLSNNATIDKFLGDGVMAFWGAPLFSHLQAYSSICASLQIISKIKTDPVFKEIDVGIGINTGPMIVGNLGSAGYTVIGENVNIASRIESLNKQYGSKILVSGSFIDKLEEEMGKHSSLKKVYYREIDYIRIQGMSKKVTLFDVVNFEEFITKNDREAYSYFSDGLRLYRRQRWDEAEHYFRLSNKYLNGDPVSKTFIEKCKRYKKIGFDTETNDYLQLLKKY